MTAHKPFSPEQLASDAAQGKLTPAVARWLAHLRDIGDRKRDGWKGGNTPYRSMQAGLTDWVTPEYPALDGYHETLTPAGLAALEAYERQQKGLKP